MALNVTGKCKVFKFEDKGSWGKCSLTVSRKNKDGAWENEWYNAKLVKDAFEKAKAGIPDKSRIELKNAFLSSQAYNGKTYINIVITDLEITEKAKEVVAEQTPPEDFTDVDLDSMADNLPF